MFVDVIFISSLIMIHVLGSKKRARGPTKKKEIWDLASDEQILVTFNELCQPIGDEGNELKNFLGTLVRMPQHIGIHYPEWRKVPKEKKEDLWSIIKVHCFNVL